MGYIKDVTVLRKWREHEHNFQEFKNSTFALIAHPDATPEQIALVVLKAREAQEGHFAALNLMREKGYPV